MLEIEKQDPGVEDLLNSAKLRNRVFCSSCNESKKQSRGEQSNAGRDFSTCEHLEQPLRDMDAGRKE